MTTSLYPPEQPLVFGYGSLVACQRRLPGATGIPAELSGYARSWEGHYVEVNGVYVCALTLKKQQNSKILGVLIHDLPEYRELLEQQEIGYEKVNITNDTYSPWMPGEKDIICFIGNNSVINEAEPVIIKSYLYVILYGYLQTFGEHGVKHFLQTTDNWNFPIMDDIENPVYPRFIDIPNTITKWFDNMIELYSK